MRTLFELSSQSRALGTTSRRESAPRCCCGTCRRTPSLWRFTTADGVRCFRDGKPKTPPSSSLPELLAALAATRRGMRWRSCRPAGGSSRRAHAGHLLNGSVPALPCSCVSTANRLAAPGLRLILAVACLAPEQPLWCGGWVQSLPATLAERSVSCAGNCELVLNLYTTSPDSGGRLLPLAVFAALSKSKAKCPATMRYAIEYSFDAVIEEGQRCRIAQSNLSSPAKSKLRAGARWRGSATVYVPSGPVSLNADIITTS